MNSPTDPTAALAVIPDVQGTPDTRAIAIDRVGIKSIRHPLAITDRDECAQHVVATLDMYVQLPAEEKGTHMSRFVEVLHDVKQSLNVESFPSLLEATAEALNADAAHVIMRFPFFLEKEAPVSRVKSLLDYAVTISGDYDKGATTQQLEVVVPITTLCPCSKQISDYGAHNQRSHVTVKVESHAPVWIEDIVQLVEATASCELFGILKRPDEKYVTERAYDNPKFVEDIVRDVALQLNEDDRIIAYTVESENFESIHNHSAYAALTRTRA